MADEPDLYAYLATSKVSDVTQAQLEQSLENSFINKTNIEFWKGPLTVHRVIEAARTYPHGLPIPESGAVALTVCNPGQPIDIQPPGTEIWRLTGLWMAGDGGTATMNISYFDGSLEQLVKSAVSAVTGGVIIGAYGATSDVEVTALPILLTNSLYFRLEETGTTNPCTVRYSYQKVSL